MSVKDHKGMKGLKSKNLRDHMSEAELIFTALAVALAELSTRQIAESDDATGMPANESAAKTGGALAKRARLELEGRTGKKVVSGENFLPSAKKAVPHHKSESRENSCSASDSQQRRRHPEQSP